MRSAKMTLVFLGGATVASVFTATPSFESLLSMLSPAAAAASALFSSSADVDGRFSSSSSPLPGQKKSCRKSVVVGRERMPLLAYLGPASAAAARPESLLSSSGVGESVLGCCASASLRSSSPRGAPAPVESIVKPPDARALHPHPATSLSDRSDRLSLSASPPSLRLSCLFGAFEYPPPSRGGRLNPHVAVRMRFWGTCP